MSIALPKPTNNTIMTSTNPARCHVSAEIISFPPILHFRELPDISSKAVGERLADLTLKRIFDIVCATALLIVASPFIALAALFIKLESKGPAIFIQERVGAKYEQRNGRIVWKTRLFRCYKLRTMKDGANPEIHREYLIRFRNGLTELGPKRAPYKLDRDPRITRIGHWLRKASLDELPQLVNVIKGDMSLVGPRPVPVYEIELYDEPHFSRLAARPGITGLWQVYGRSRVTFEQMIEMDIEYAKHSCLWCDLKLLMLTIHSVVSRKGAA